MDIRLASLADEWQPGDQGPFARAVAEARAAGRPLVDLIGTTPAECGLAFPAATLRAIAEQALDDPAVRGYRPDPLGNPAARAAIADWYRRRNADADPARVVMTPGTSFGYFAALRLLCEPGDELLVPKPGYPLFDDLARAAGVGVRNYHLRLAPSGTWEFDPEELAFQVTPRTRAVAVVSPHNPTGLHLSAAQLAAVGAICRRHGLALLFDEVFSEFAGPAAWSEPVPPHPSSFIPHPSVLARPLPSDFPLAITFNGFSKMLSLPQWKIAWMKVDGSDAAAVTRFMAAAEHFADTFLPCSELSMAMAPGILAAGDPAVSGWLATEFAARRRAVRHAFPWPATSWDSGSYVCLKVGDGTPDGDRTAENLLRDRGLLVHPGSWYGLGDHVVVGAVTKYFN